jgi:mannose-6-phosphate isomerase-like protein (cupin superfamily)
MKVSAQDLIRQLPGPATARWPTGERFVRALAHGSMSVELYAHVGTDPQSPHDQDELYLVLSGAGRIAIADDSFAFAPGDCFFVGAGVEHRFVEFTPGFTTWVVFWGPAGGEPPPAPLQWPGNAEAP